MDGSGRTVLGSVGRFSYEEAFSRNLGWLTEWEQQALRAKRVAIAGMGGVGGVHVLTLARAGIGSFHIADLDRFELPNFNRQIGATTGTLGAEKVDVLAAMAKDINPDLNIERFGEGVTAGNLDAFLAGVDLFIDGLDFFEIDIRRRVFARCRELRIPAITAAPLGMGTAFLVFDPDGMSFEEYFGFGSLPPEQQYVRFLLGLAPKALHFGYLADPSRVDLAGHRGPSTVAAVQLCAGVTAAEAIKLLLGRGPVRPAPHFHQFDAYRGKWVSGCLRRGNQNPLQRLKLALANRAFAAMSRKAAPPISPVPGNELERIVDIARWAPSGDNTQPWRIRIAGSDILEVHIKESKDDVYDYRGGEPTLLSLGVLLETIRIAASAVGRGAEWSIAPAENLSCITVHVPKRDNIAPDPLLAAVFLRSVDRRPYSPRPLTERHKKALAEAVAGALELHWYESTPMKWGFAKLNAQATAIRLRSEEAFRVHRRVIDWDSQYSRAGIPARTVGLDPMTLRIMRWAMQDWGRLRRMNALPGATLPASLQLDYIPSLCCAAFFSLSLSGPRPSDVRHRMEALLKAGIAIQRFWLTATRMNLAIQPNFAPVIFAWYGREAIAFTQDDKLLSRAQRLNAALEDFLGPSADSIAFLGRIGRRSPNLAKARSVRHDFAELIHS